MIYLHVKIFPEILCHEAKKCQEGPPKAVEAGVTIVWIPPSFHACVPLWAAPKKSEGQSLRNEETSKTSKMIQHHLHAALSHFSQKTEERSATFE